MKHCRSKQNHCMNCLNAYKYSAFSRRTRPTSAQSIIFQFHGYVNFPLAFSKNICSSHIKQRVTWLRCCSKCVKVRPLIFVSNRKQLLTILLWSLFRRPFICSLLATGAWLHQDRVEITHLCALCRWPCWNKMRQDR